MIKRWVKERKSIDNAFVRLNLKNKEDKLLEHPQFLTWIKYVQALNVETGGPSWTAVSKLTKYYDSEVVARMIAAVKKKPGMEKMANDLQTQQFQGWFHGSFTDTPDNVFRALGLGYAGDKLLESPLFPTWVNYVKFLNENTKKQQVGFLAPLAARFDDDTITAIIETAKKTPSTMEFAKKLRAEQVERWLTHGKSPASVWLYLKFDIVGDNVLASPEFKNLVKYVRRYNEIYPDKKTTLVSVLDYYLYRGSSKAIVAALTNKNPGSENISKQVEKALFEIWLPKYNPSEVFRILKLRRSPDKVLENPLLKTWVKYMNMFNMKNPNEKTTMIDVLRTQFGDGKLSKILVKAKSVPSTKDLGTQLHTAWLTKLAVEDNGT
ncbi:RxLR effector protein [Phytophthora megakarya]|uniref:RxLR effector protein n=1 Tax=Phytophthora megakarya TaxID=4795 RepID=A0A225UZW4_9STRA|nr:RxLR effector protein [Phytophthora megakarya]